MPYYIFKIYSAKLGYPLPLSEVSDFSDNSMILKKVLQSISIAKYSFLWRYN